MFLANGAPGFGAPPYALNIGRLGQDFKDFAWKSYIAPVVFSAPPRGRDIPERTVRLGHGGTGGQADIGQMGVIQLRKGRALAMGRKAQTDSRNQTVDKALRLDATDGQRGGGNRGKYDLSFQDIFIGDPSGAFHQDT